MFNLNNKSTKEGIFTTVVRVKGSNKYKVAPVKSSKAVNIGIWIELSKVLARIYISTPIKVGDLICKNILNTGIDIICTRDLLDD